MYSYYSLVITHDDNLIGIDQVFKLIIYYIYIDIGHSYKKLYKTLKNRFLGKYILYIYGNYL